MRLNKVSELIHNSTNHQNLDSAGVSVHFQEIVDLVRLFIYFLSIHNAPLSTNTFCTARMLEAGSSWCDIVFPCKTDNFLTFWFTNTDAESTYIYQ
jgi:hypothetical protein